MRIQHATLSEIDQKQFEIIKKEALDAEQKAVQAARKAAKTSVKADNAEQAALKAGVKLTDKDKEKS
ncbi:MAG: hypothetical protein JRI99_10845 [Deltaproteobacteria bacterium]|nr:hypothetical protein [Deltaproteobacteria bacterium]